MTRTSLTPSPLTPAPLALAPHTTISRPLSMIEYLHASVGTSPKTIERAREVVLLLEGRGQLPLSRWQAALDRVVAANPVCRLRVAGTRARARLESDGVPMPLRRITNCDWDGMTEAGSEVIRATPLRLAGGPMAELIVMEWGAADNARSRVVVRGHHTAMDGIGAFHTMQELFRALRDEPLAGCNGNFSDVDLMRAVGNQRPGSKRDAHARLTGAARGNDPGSRWQRISIPARRANSMFRLIAAFAEIAARYDPGKPCLFAIPVSLRRHLDGLVSAQNFSSMVLVPLAPGEGVDAYKHRFNALLEEKRDVSMANWLDLFRYLPFTWLDRLLNRSAQTVATRPTRETVLISHLGYFKTGQFCCEGFSAETFYGLPQPESAFCLAFGTEKGFELVFGMPNVYGCDGRFDDVIATLKRHLDAG